MSRLLRQLSYLLALAVVVAGCEEGTTTGPEGQVRGVVMVEGVGVSNVTVELTGPQTRTTTTDEAGRYSVDEVESGAYVVSVRDVPENASFPAVSRSAVVSGSQTVTVDFLGNFIRTASISGSVVAGSQGLSGVTVELTGVEEGETLTGAGGEFQFAGLRAGTYEVEISGFPESVTFPVTRTTVELSTGESRLTTFEGSAELTASVVIRSITRRTPDGGTESVDPQNLSGAVDVTVTVDRAEDTLVSVELLLGDEVVGQQAFDGNVQAPDPAPATATPLDIDFTVNTAEFDPATGAVRFENGSRLLTARLASEEGGPSASLASVPVRLRNEDTFTGSLSPGVGPVAGDDGEDWVGGPLAVEVIPVLYDPSRSVASAIVGIRRAEGGQVRVATAGGAAPFTVVFEDDGAAAPHNVAEYQTPAGATDEIRVVSGTYEGGGAVPGVPAVVVPRMRVDNLGPAPADFRLPRQSQEHDCCLLNWVGADFAFLDAVELGVDAGVGGVIATVHAGDAGLTDMEITALPEILMGGDLTPSDQNSAYRAVAVARDALGNATSTPLAASPGNSLTNPAGAVFGVDLALPQLGFGPASVADRAVNPPPGSAWVIAITDPLAGAGPMPSRATVRLDAPGVASGSAEACPFPGTSACNPTEDAVARQVPTEPEGYLTFESVALDRAGNRSNPRSRTILRDVTSPEVVSVSGPSGSTTPGGPISVSALVSDNVELHRGWVGLAFDGAGGGDPPPVAALAAPQQLATPFSGDLTSTATVTRSTTLAIGLEEVVVGAETDAPSGAPRALSGLRVVVVDVGGNTAGRTEPFDVAAVPSSFSVEERGASGGVGDWTLAAGGDDVCRADSVDGCAEGTPETVTLTAEARGTGGVFEEPFQEVHFVLLADGEPQWIGRADEASLTDGTGPLGRSWVWSLEWSPDPTVPSGMVELLAIGVDGDGNALRTAVLGSVTVEG